MTPPSDRRIIVVLLVVALTWFICGLAWGAKLAKAEGIGQAVALERPAPEPAPPAVVPPAALTADLEAARAYWQGSEPRQCLTTTVEYAVLPPDRAGEATLPTLGWTGACVMLVIPGLEAWNQCAVVVHEYGHWLGLDHNPDPASPMFVGGPYYAAIPQCEDRRSDV